MFSATAICCGLWQHHYCSNLVTLGGGAEGLWCFTNTQPLLPGRDFCIHMTFIVINCCEAGT